MEVFGCVFSKIDDYAGFIRDFERMCALDDVKRNKKSFTWTCTWGECMWIDFLINVNGLKDGKTAEMPDIPTENRLYVYFWRLT